MKKPNLRLGSSCPQCGSVMGIEESDWNKCGCCGYPEEEIDEDDEDDEDNEGDMDYDEHYEGF